MTALADIQTAYKYALQDKGSQLEEINSTATTAVRDAAITQALQWYSRRIPLTKTVSVATSTTSFYTVPTDWTNGKSRIVSVEYPLDQKPPTYLLPYSGGGIRMQRRETGWYYYLDPNPSGSFRLTYTTQHLASASTIDTTHVEIIGRMAASIAAGEFAARYANSVTNNLDAVNYRTKEQEWRSVRDMLMAQVDTELRRDEWAAAMANDPTAGLDRGWKS